MKKLTLNAFRIKNFKAVKDSRAIKFTPLTVFIGNNGSGKSSIIEGMETIQSIVLYGLDDAMMPWKGLEYIAYQKAFKRDGRSGKILSLKNPIRFYLRGYGIEGPYKAWMEISSGAGMNEIFIQREEFISEKAECTRDETGRAVFKIFNESSKLREKLILDKGDSILEQIQYGSVPDWQFLTLIPQFMGAPNPQRRATQNIKLEKDGSNIAEYLFHLRNRDLAAFEGIIETLQYIIPYARDLQTSITSELDRNVYLQMTESDFKIPGWLLSTGTLRLVAILALLRHPEPPPLIVIEEIENGLDPRTINLLVEEIRNAVESGRTQIIMTTHSPYLLDLLHISQIVLAERDESNEPIFTRPADREELQEWAKTFTPGKLYTMNQMGRRLKK